MEEQTLSTEIGKIHLFWGNSLQPGEPVETAYGRFLETCLDLLLEEAQDPSDA